MPSERLERWARVGITVQFLALVRNLGEVFRLKLVRGSALTLGGVEPFVVGALITAVLCWLAVTLYFFGRYRLALALAVLTVIVLLLYKFLILG